MDITNVFIIIGRGWSKQKIVNELREEGYKHNFFFGQNQDWEILQQRLDYSQEVWYFGYCEEYETYKYARKMGYDLWKMGD